MGVLADLLKERFGIKTRPLASVAGVNVGAVAAQIVLNHPDRVGLVIVNLSVNIIYISPQPTVAANNGIRLDPNGGWRSLVWDEDFELVSSEWWAVAPAGASVYYTLQEIGEK